MKPLPSGLLLTLEKKEWTNELSAGFLKNFYTINSTHSFQQNLTPSREANARTRYICHMPICDSLRQGQVGNPPLTIIQPPPPPPRDTGGDWSVFPQSRFHNTQRFVSQWPRKEKMLL